MHKLIQTILENYKEEIKVVEESNLEDFNNVEKGISISRQYLQQLRICVRENEFVSLLETGVFLQDR